MPGPPPFVVSSTAAVVEAWSTARLPMEPEGWMLDLRAELQAAIRRLASRRDQSLACTYESADESTCDVEDVLVYNVGTAAFGELLVGGVILERSFLHPLPPPVPLDGEAAHQHRYELTEHRAPACWTPGAVVASFASAPIAAPLSASAVWLAVRRGELRVHRRTEVGPLCVRLTTTFPVLSRSSLYATMKPVLDGVVGALHVHDGTDLTEVSRRLSATLAEHPSEVRSLLKAPTADALGARPVVQPFRGGLAWHPADDRLVAIDLRVDVAPELRVTGDVFEALPL